MYSYVLNQLYTKEQHTNWYAALLYYSIIY